MNKIYLFIFLIFILFQTYSEEGRFFQFVGDENSNSFIALEAGTSTGINLLSSRIQFSILYSLFLIPGYSISTDLFLFTKNFNNNLNLKIGLGGGIIFEPKINDFTSSALLRSPINLEIKDLYLTVVPMFGISMFEYKTDWKWNISVGVGYKFDLSKKKATVE